MSFAAPRYAGAGWLTADGEIHRVMRVESGGVQSVQSAEESPVAYAPDQGGAGVSPAEPARRDSMRRKRVESNLPRWRDVLGWQGILLILILFGLFAWLYQNQFYRLIRMWQNPDWSHGFLIPFFCLYMLNTKKAELLTGEHRGSLAGLAFIISGVLIYAYFLYAKVGYPQDLSMIVVLLGLVLLLRGWRALRLSLFPILFFILAIPPPDRVYKAVTHPLQQIAAKAATWVLNMIPGAEVEQGGINIAYYMRGGRDGMFTVAGACSGMRSLMAFAALGLAMAYFTPRPAWQRVAMAIFVFPVALFCNVMRVIITGAFQMYDHGNLASGTPHTVLGLFMFALGFVIYMTILWVMDNLFVESPESSTSGDKNAGAAT